MRFILASQSPARLKTLQLAGVEPEVVVSGVDESVLDGLGAEPLAQGLAELKARAVAHQPGSAGALVLGCDSVLDFEGEVWGKPADAEDAVVRLARMRGNCGVLHTGHCLIDTNTGAEIAAVVATTVHIADMTDAEIRAYVATGEPLQVAGSFTIDGLGGSFIQGIEGCHHNVVGVSLPRVRTMFAELGYSWTELWR